MPPPPRRVNGERRRIVAAVRHTHRAESPAPGPRSVARRQDGLQSHSGARPCARDSNPVHSTGPPESNPAPPPAMIPETHPETRPDTLPGVHTLRLAPKPRESNPPPVSLPPPLCGWTSGPGIGSLRALKKKLHERETSSTPLPAASRHNRRPVGQKQPVRATLRGRCRGKCRGLRSGRLSGILCTATWITFP